ncbi:MAG: 30S ribosomal protein S11 [Acidobacteria bacterium]|nr:30S ribosomal protein S11 [Acidobacteriota bacterium]
MVKKKSTKKVVKKTKRVVERGFVFINATFNNTIISASDAEGNIVSWASGGTSGFKGSRKGTSFAAQVAAQNVAKKAADMGMKSVEVHVKGPGSGRESAIRALQAVGLEVRVIKDTTPIPHNGCRPRKKRRV